MVNFVNNLSLAMISMFGAMMYMAGGITLGSVSSFVLYSRKFSGPINEFANIISELQSALAAAERVFMLLDEPGEEPDAPHAACLAGVRGEVEMRDVCFAYPGGGESVLHGFSLHARPGQVVAIVGPTGAGKTTIINLLMRFYDADGGRDLRGWPGDPHADACPACGALMPWCSRIRGFFPEPCLKTLHTGARMLRVIRWRRRRGPLILTDSSVLCRRGMTRCCATAAQASPRGRSSF